MSVVIGRRSIAGVTRALHRVPTPVLELLGRPAARSALLRRATLALLGGLSARDVVIPRRSGAGLRFNAGGSLPTYALGIAEPHTQEALASILRPGMTMYDIGCNVGFFTVIAARAVGPAGRVVAFDPLASNAEATRRNAARNGLANIEVHELAVGAADGRVGFAPGAGPSWGRLDPVTRHGEVDVVVLDPRIAAGKLPVPDVVKLDIEGGEADALAGLASTLLNHRPIVIVEVHGTEDVVRAALAGFDLRRLDSRRPDDNAHFVATPRS